MRVHRPGVVVYGGGDGAGSASVTPPSSLPEGKLTRRTVVLARAVVLSWAGDGRVDVKLPCWQSATVIKTQIQIPDALYREAKRVAADYEMSFAEVVRRSLERTLPGYPPRQNQWRAPEPVSLGIRDEIDPDEWRLLANEPDYLPRRARSPVNRRRRT